MRAFDLLYRRQGKNGRLGRDAKPCRGRPSMQPDARLRSPRHVPRHGVLRHPRRTEQRERVHLGQRGIGEWRSVERSIFAGIRIMDREVLTCAITQKGFRGYGVIQFAMEIVRLDVARLQFPLGCLDPTLVLSASQSRFDAHAGLRCLPGYEIYAPDGYTHGRSALDARLLTSVSLSSPLDRQPEGMPIDAVQNQRVTAAD